VIRFYEMMAREFNLTSLIVLFDEQGSLPSKVIADEGITKLLLDVMEAHLEDEDQNSQFGANVAQILFQRTVSPDESNFPELYSRTLYDLKVHFFKFEKLAEKMNWKIEGF
jgi:hypothetical protein